MQEKQEKEKQELDRQKRLAKLKEKVRPYTAAGTDSIVHNVCHPVIFCYSFDFIRQRLISAETLPGSANPPKDGRNAPKRSDPLGADLYYRCFIGELAQNIFITHFFTIFFLCN